MSTVTAERPAPPAAPVQLGFLDAPAEPPRIRLAIIGMLTRQPEVRVSGDRRVHLFVEVMQPKGGLPIVTMLHADETERPALEHHAARLLPGSAVLLRGQGLALTRHHGLDAIELRRCASVSPIEFTATEQPA